MLGADPGGQMTSPNVPAWLPKMLVVFPWTNESYNALYVYFIRDLLSAQIMFNGKPLRFRRGMEDGKVKPFWHITSKNEDNGDRLPDFRRIERMPWIRAIIENVNTPEVQSWQYEEQSEIRTYLWLREHDYVVILSDAPHSVFLVTAFYVEGNYRRSLERKYAARLHQS